FTAVLGDHRGIHSFPTRRSSDLVQGVLAQTITGTVSDESGVPLPGVNIVEKGTNNGVSSDFDGNYSITVSDGNATLVYSSLGMRSEEHTSELQSRENLVCRLLLE